MAAKFPPERYQDAAALVATHGFAAGRVALGRAIEAGTVGGDTKAALEVAEVVLTLLEKWDGERRAGC